MCDILNHNTLYTCTYTCTPLWLNTDWLAGTRLILSFWSMWLHCSQFNQPSILNFSGNTFTSIHMLFLDILLPRWNLRICHQLHCSLAKTLLFRCISVFILTGWRMENICICKHIFACYPKKEVGRKGACEKSGSLSHPHLPTHPHSWKKCFCLREPVFWGRIFLIWRRNFPNME